MMPQQQQNQNLPAVSQSLLQQTGSGAHVKPFSIREYVAASRDRNILNNWPFDDKHLQLCLKHGLNLKEVLPPFGRQTSLAEPLKGCSNLMHSPNDNNNNNNNNNKEADSCKLAEVTNHSSSHEEGNQHNCSNISANLSQPPDTCTLPSSTHVHKSSTSLLPSFKVVKGKRKRGRGRSKKRSMVDILTVARHSTLEEIHRMNKFCYAETVIQGCQQTVPYENISKSELAIENSCRKTACEDHGVANVDMAAKGPLLLKFKLNGCNVHNA